MKTFIVSVEMQIEPDDKVKKPLDAAKEFYSFIRSTRPVVKVVSLNLEKGIDRIDFFDMEDMNNWKT